jgi:hypothetical protein
VINLVAHIGVCFGRVPTTAVWTNEKLCMHR